MNVKKRILSAFMAVAMLATIISTTVFAGSSPTISVSSKTATVGTSVDITVSLENNPGIVSMLLNIEYDKGALKLTKVTDAGVLGAQSHSDDLDLNPYILYWLNGTATSDYTVNGTVATLTFDVAANANPGEYPITVTYDKDKDGIFNKDFEPVDFVTANGAVTVQEKPKQNMTGITFTGKEFTYDGTEKTLAASGVPKGATVTYTSDDFDADGKAIDAKAYTVKATVKKDGYNDWTKEAVLTIKPKTVSVIGLKAENKVYDGTDQAKLSGGSVSGIVARDSSDQYCDEHKCYRIKYSIPDSGKFSDANAGNNKTVSIDKITLDGCSAQNYTVTQPAVLKANITKAPITVTAKNVTLKTGDSIPLFDDKSYEITAGKLFGNDKLEGKLSTNCTSTAVAKEYSITQGTLKAGANYNLTFVPGKLTVVNKTPQNIIVADTVEEKTYGDAGFKVTVTPDKNSKLDNFTMTSSNTNVAAIDQNGNVAIKNAGTTTISVKEAGNAEYAPFEKAWTLTVKKAKIAITADDKSKRLGQTDPELTYVLTGELVGEDKITGALTRAAGEALGKYDILIGTLAVNDNYDITFNKGTFEIIEKTPQTIKVEEPGVKVYGDAPFKLSITPDEVSKLNVFTYESDNTAVAAVSDDGTVTIAGAGEATIKVKEPGNDDYAASEATVKLTVKPITVNIIAIDMSTKTATINGILDVDKDNVDLDFEKLKTTVISSEKTTVGETTKIKTVLKVTSFVFKGEKAKNYAASKEAAVETTVLSSLSSDKLTDDENVTAEAAPAGDNTIIITDISVASESETEKITLDVTTIEDTKINTVAIPKAVVDKIAAVNSNVSLEIKIKDGNDKNATILLNAQALAAIQTSGMSTVTISVGGVNADELTDAQSAKVADFSTKTPVIYSINAIDERGNNAASDFGELGSAKVTLSYTMPNEKGNIVVVYLGENGDTTTVQNAVYDAVNHTVTVILEHFSEYMIYTEPVTVSRRGGGGGGGGTSSFTVKFNSNGGSKVDNSIVEKNSTLNEPEAPSKEGYKFEGWYSDAELSKAYDFSSKVTGSFTLYAKWTEAENKPEADKPSVSEQKNLFSDVNENDWFYSNVKYVFENKLMSGVSEDRFAPNDTLTRAMLVTVLYRHSGEPAIGEAVAFGDVDADAYYANSVAWAKENEIVSGVSENEFAPNDNITREQIAAIIYRYAKYKGYDVSVSENTNILSFDDFDSISEFAIIPMQYAAGSGLIKGKSNTTINPKDNATRAEIAAILQRFIEE